MLNELLENLNVLFSVASELINDMRLGTFYPPEIYHHLELDDAVLTVQELIGYIQDARREAEKESSE